MFDTSPGLARESSVGLSKSKSKPARRRILLLSNGHGVSNEFLSFLQDSVACEVLECAMLTSDDAATPRFIEPFGGESRECLFELVREHHITDVAVEWPAHATAELRDELCHSLLTMKMQGVKVHEVSHFCERVIGRVPLHHESARGLIAASHYHFDRRWQRVKRASDVVGASSLLVLTAPLLLAAALAVRYTSHGPVFYRQERVGLEGRVFSIVKFRSMRADAEALGGARFASRDDDRITPVGKFMRRTRIDELPQLFNVLVGHMSLVGPRPERPVFVDEYKKSVPLYDLRHRVKPGITGWAQVKDPYATTETGTRNKLSRDLYYIKNGSLWMDLKIMVQTAWVMVSCRGSH